MNKTSTKDKVLLLLKECKGEPLSGECIAEKLHLSRTSIWKAVKKLQEEGFSISAGTNSGYILSGISNRLEKNEIIKNLSAEARSFCSVEGEDCKKLEVYKTIDSTNTEAKKRLSASIDSTTLAGTFLVANEQTAGRGRLGRSFYSPSFNGVYLSVVFKNNERVLNTAVMTAAAGVAVCRVLKKYNISPLIKWVNDIFVNRKKVCGILTEGSLNFESGVIDSVVLGVGINIAASKMLPFELKDIAGPVFSDVEKAPSRNIFVADILNEICAIFLHKEVMKFVMDEYKALSLVKGKKVEVHCGEDLYTAIVEDITSEAHLIVKKEDGTIRELNSGEVSIKVNEGLKNKQNII